MSKGRITLIIAGVLTFAAAFQIAHKQRLALKPYQDSATQFHRLSLLPRGYAQASEGEFWPQLDPTTRVFALPLNAIPRGYTVGKQFKPEPAGHIDALLLGKINNSAAYTLKPVDPIVSEYRYFGHAFASEKEFIALRDAIRQGAALDADIPVPQGSGTLGASKLYRLRNKLEEVLAKDGVIPVPDRNALNNIPVLIEKPHDGKAWVFFLNNRMEQMPYPGPFPMLPSIVEGQDTATPAAQ
ncbi:MAG: hypothetical protein IT366_10955 [Candidatus Hydrogenedentes bacterium]|nr:hypothetical protein [Candidatus Hydrogenedentota bacterium]